MQRMTWCCLIIIFVIMTQLTPATVAEEEKIHQLMNQDNDGSVAAECQRNNDQMKCQFVRVLIRKVVKEKPSEEEKIKRFNFYKDKKRLDSLLSEDCKIKNKSKSELEQSLFDEQKDLKYKWPRHVIDEFVSSVYKTYEASTAWRKKRPLLHTTCLGYHDSRHSDHPAAA